MRISCAVQGLCAACLSTGIGKIWEQTCTCGVCLCTNTACFFLETVPQSCKIGNKTTLEKWAQKIDPAQKTYKSSVRLSTAECGRRWHHRRGTALSLKSVFFKHLLFQVLQHLDMNLPLGSWWFFSAHKHHTYKHYSNSLYYAGGFKTQVFREARNIWWSY